MHHRPPQVDVGLSHQRVDIVGHRAAVIKNAHRVGSNIFGRDRLTTAFGDGGASLGRRRAGCFTRANGLHRFIRDSLHLLAHR